MKKEQEHKESLESPDKPTHEEKKEPIKVRNVPRRGRKLQDTSIEKRANKSTDEKEDICVLVPGGVPSGLKVGRSANISLDENK